MNDNQEALTLLCDEIEEPSEWTPSDDLEEAQEKLQKLVNKSIPMKPIIRTFGDGSQTYCSKCNKPMMRLSNRVSNYCPKCGQKQDNDSKVSDENE